MEINEIKFNVKWSDEDQEYVGTCDKFKSLSWLHKDKVLALTGIIEVVLQTILDLKRSKTAI